MNRSGIVRVLVWSAVPMVAGVVVTVGVARRTPAPPAAPAGATTILPAGRSRISIPPVDDDAWRRHPSVLSVTAVAGLLGGWLVLDARASRVHHLDADLDLVRTFGGPGDGPGELSRPAGMTVAGDSLVAVVDAAGVRIDLFTPEGRFVDRLTVRVPGCPVGLSGGILPWRKGLVTYGVCGGPGGGRWAVASVALDGAARILASVPLQQDGRLVPPLGRGVIGWLGRVWIGSPDGCFEAVEPPEPGHRNRRAEPGSPGAAGRACLDTGPSRPVPDSVRRTLTPGGARRGGPAVVLPERWPPFLATTWSSRGPLLVLPPDDSAPDGTLALLGSDGRLTVVSAPEPVWPGPDGYLLTRTLLEGTAFRTWSPE